MVSTGTETAQATVLGPGFDSQQVHNYDFCYIVYFCSGSKSSSHSRNSSGVITAVIVSSQPGESWQP